MVASKNSTQTFEISAIREEYNTVSDDLFSTFYTSIDLIDAYTELLRQAILKNVFQSRKQEANVINLLAKLKTQKELIELASDSKKLDEVQKASVSFRRKTKANNAYLATQSK